MVSKVSFELSVLATFVFSANSRHISKDGRSNNLQERAIPTLPASSQDEAITLPANFSTVETVTTTGVQVSCDSMYGFALNKKSCQNVLDYCPSGTMVESWAYPSDVPPGESVDEELPIKVFSNDATCTIQVAIPGGGGVIAHASPLNITQAARAVYDNCVIGRDGVGGRAYQIGGDDRLIVVMAGFNPHVDCLGAMATPLDSCGSITQEMRKDYGPQKFGRPWDKTINYALPLVLTAPDGKCQIVIDTLGPTVQANWNGIWQAVLSTIALCGRVGKGGKASVVNEAFPITEGLFVQVHDRVLPPPLAVGPNGTVDTATVETVTPLSAVSATEPWGLLLPSGASESPAILPSSAPTVASS